jgi:hypothetical protein
MPILENPPTHKVRLLVGGNATHGVPQATAFHASDALVVATRTHRLLTHRPGDDHTATSLILVEAANQHLVGNILERVIEQVLPLLLAGSQALMGKADAALRALIEKVGIDADALHISIACIAWPRLRLLYTGANRHVLVRGRGHNVAVLTPRHADDPGLVTSSLIAGDWLVMLAQSTSQIIHLSEAGLAVRNSDSPQAVCAKLVQAAAKEAPESHHAVLALAVE